MIQQGFSLGDRDWYIMCAYDIRTEDDLREVRKTLLASGMSRLKVEEAIKVLSTFNSGLTYTNFREHLTLVFISKAADTSQLYDTVTHEQRHAADHIGGYYGLDNQGEDIAYLQGEIGRQMFPAVAMLLCPKCGHLLP